MICDIIEDDYLGAQIGRGVQGAVYKNKKDHHQVIKKSNPRSVDEIASLESEYTTARIGGIEGVSPAIHDFVICPKEKEKYVGYIFMDNIIGKEITTKSEINDNFDKILKKLNILKNKGVDYKDYKASNIMIGRLPNTDYDDVYIIDYGVSVMKPVDEIIHEEDEIYRGLLDSLPVDRSLIKKLRTLQEERTREAIEGIWMRTEDKKPSKKTRSRSKSKGGRSKKTYKSTK
jgi:serine/threonine protein kinase